jgi:hypothetical protein
MTIVIVGEIKERNARTLTILDAVTKEYHKVTAIDDDTLELPAGTTGLFIGESVGGELKITRKEIRKLLDPLYEEDLMGIAGKIVVELIDDPFPELFARKEEELKELEESEKLEAFQGK